MNTWTPMAGGGGAGEPTLGGAGAPGGGALPERPRTACKRLEQSERDARGGFSGAGAPEWLRDGGDAGGGGSGGGVALGASLPPQRGVRHVRFDVGAAAAVEQPALGDDFGLVGRAKPLSHRPSGAGGGAQPRGPVAGPLTDGGGGGPFGRRCEIGGLKVRAEASNGALSGMRS